MALLHFFVEWTLPTFLFLVYRFPLYISPFFPSVYFLGRTPPVRASPLRSVPFPPRDLLPRYYTAFRSRSSPIFLPAFFCPPPFSSGGLFALFLISNPPSLWKRPATSLEGSFSRALFGEGQTPLEYEITAPSPHSFDFFFLVMSGRALFGKDISGFLIGALPTRVIFSEMPCFDQEVLRVSSYSRGLFFSSSSLRC